MYAGMADVAALTGDEGAGATLGNDAAYILSTIPTVQRAVAGETCYVITKGDGHIGASITEVAGITVTFDPSITDWRSGGTSSNAKTVDGVELLGYYAQSDATNGAPIIIETTQAGTLTIFLGGDVGTGKTVNMTEGENGLTATVLSTGATIENGAKPAAAISAGDALVYTLEANKTYKFFIGSTKWRLAAIRYIPSAAPTAIEAVKGSKATDGSRYSLNGVRTANPQKGIYIMNGKKVAVK
jgi:hypothetical protein